MATPVSSVSVFTNQASHHVDLLNWVLGGEIESVYALSDTFLVKTETEDTGVAIIRYKNGAIGLIEATTAVRPQDLEGSISVLGSEGSVEIAGFAVNEIKHWNFKSPVPADAEIREKYSVNPPHVYGYGHQAYLQDVVRCLNGEIINPVDGREGRKSLELITAIYESIESKQPVFFPFTPKRSRLGSAQTNQSAFGLLRSLRDSTNQGCRSDVCDSTRSIITRRPRPCAFATTASKSAKVPNIGSTSQ